MLKATLAIGLIVSSLPAWAKQAEMVFKSQADLDKCVATYAYDTGVCLEAYKKYVASHPKEALASAKKARMTFAHWVALPFFDQALKNKQSGVCADSDFHQSMISALSLPSDRSENALARTLFGGACYKDVLPAAQKELSSSPNSYFQDSVCPTMKKNNVAHAACEQKAEPAVVEKTAEKLPVLEKNKIKLADSIKTYVGPEGAKMTMAQIEGTPLFLIKFDGVRGAWNGKTLLHKEDANSKESKDYWTEKDGQRWVTVAKRGFYGGNSEYNVYLPGDQEQKFYYSEKESANANAPKILESF